jgi:hypothetical protein
LFKKTKKTVWGHAALPHIPMILLPPAACVMIRTIAKLFYRQLAFFFFVCVQGMGAASDLNGDFLIFLGFNFSGQQG